MATTSPPFDMTVVASGNAATIGSPPRFSLIKAALITLAFTRALGAFAEAGLSIDTNACANAIGVMYRFTPPSGGGSLAWSLYNDAASTASFAPTPSSTDTVAYVNTGPGLGIYTVEVTVNGLTFSTRTEVYAAPSVAASAANSTIPAGGSTTLTASGADVYTWSPAAGLSATTGASVTAQPASTTVYTVTGISATTGCQDSAAVTVTVEPPACVPGVIGGIDLRGLIDTCMMFFANGHIDANWEGETAGFAGNVALNGLVASERTSGRVPFAGTIFTSAATPGDWTKILRENVGQALGSSGNVALIQGMSNTLSAAFARINSLPATPGFESVSASSLNGLNTQDGVSKTYVINVTSGFHISSEINITGDAGDVFILRWDEDANFDNGYQGHVKFHRGGAIVPHGGLTPASFLHVAGDIAASGGGENPPAPYPQGPREDNGTGSLIHGGCDFHGGGFFTGYWLTTGNPRTGETSPLNDAIFVGGWYSATTKFSMTSGTSGVYVAPTCP